MQHNTTSTELQYAVSDIDFVSQYFSKYEILRLISESSLGANYKAIQHPIERKVCLKIIARRLGRNQVIADIFTDHAKQTAQLNHPNLIQIYDFGSKQEVDSENEILYMVSEYVSGTTLDEATNEQPVHSSQVLSLMKHIGNGIAYAHHHDIVHGDLQPSKIMVNHDIVAKVSDFGLAMSLRMQKTIECVPFHPNFTAPEIRSGETHGDKLGDIYSLGTILYYLLTAVPFDSRFPSASELTSCDRRFDDVIRRATHTERSQRYQYATELLADLEQISNPNLGVIRMPAAAAYVASIEAAQNQTVRAVQKFGS